MPPTLVPEQPRGQFCDQRSSLVVQLTKHHRQNLGTVLFHKDVDELPASTSKRLAGAEGDIQTYIYPPAVHSIVWGGSLHHIYLRTKETCWLYDARYDMTSSY